MQLENFLLLILKIIISVSGEFLPIPLYKLDMESVMRNITRITITSCYMECQKDKKCGSIGLRETVDQNLYICHLLKGDNQKEVVNAKFCEWRVKSSCSATCGLGTIVYYRSCNNQYGGDQCDGTDEKTETCNVKPCHQGNVALGKESKQSTDYDNKPKYAAKYANDGDYSTSSVTYYSSPKTFWQVDLQQPIQIRLIQLYLSQYALDEDKYKNLTVLTTMEKDKPWDICQHIKVPTAQVNVTCNNDNTMAQFVRVEIDANTILYLTEVEVYSW